MPSGFVKDKFGFLAKTIAFGAEKAHADSATPTATEGAGNMITEQGNYEIEACKQCGSVFDIDGDYCRSCSRNVASDTRWVCENCGTFITEDEYRCWATCEKCERDQCPGQPMQREHVTQVKDELLTDDEMLNHLMLARTQINKAWLANMQQADYEWDQELGRAVSDAYDGLSALIERRISERTDHGDLDR